MLQCGLMAYDILYELSTREALLINSVGEGLYSWDLCTL